MKINQLKTSCVLDILLNDIYYTLTDGRIINGHALFIPRTIYNHDIINRYLGIYHLDDWDVEYYYLYVPKR